MCLVLSTQARYSSFYTPREPGEAEAHDLETSESVDELGRAVRWSIMVVVDPSPEVPQPDAEGQGQGGRRHERGDSTETPRRPGLTRAPSLSQAGRLRRRTRGAGSISALDPEINAAIAAAGSGAGGYGASGSGAGVGARRGSGDPGRTRPFWVGPDAEQWGRLDEGDEDAAATHRSIGPSAATTLTLGGGSVATLTDRTPTTTAPAGMERERMERARGPAAAAAKMAAVAAQRRHARKYSSGESDLSSVFSSAVGHRRQG